MLLLAALLLLPVFAPVDSATPVVDRIVVEGNQYLSSREIRDLLGIAIGRRYDSDALEHGIRKLLETYLAAGRMETEVLPPRLLLSPDSSKVQVVLTIREGPVVVVDRIELTGALAWPADLQPLFDTRPGRPFDPTRLDRDIDRVLTFCERNGYPYCRIEISRLQIQEGKADIGLTVYEGPMVRIRGFQVEGVVQTRQETAIREIRLLPGAPYDQQRIDRGRERLLRLGLFRRVEPAVLRLNPTGDSVTVTIKVEEAQTGVFEAVLGYVPGIGGRDGAVTGIFALSSQNIAGTGRKAHAAWTRRDSYSSDLRLGYEEPYVLGFPVSVAGDFGQTTQDSTYTTTRIGLSCIAPLTAAVDAHVRLGWTRTLPDSTGGAGLAVTREFSARAGLTVDTRDASLNPRRGVRFAFFAEFGIRQDGDITPTRVRTRAVYADMETHIPLFRRHAVAAALHGVDLHDGSRALPVSHQFFFGGTRTLRGYRENEFRGNRVVWSNLEYRILLSVESRFFLFFDTGYFEFPRNRSTRVETVRNVRMGYGFGLRLESSLGLLGLDYGVGKGDRPYNGKVHIGVQNRF
ncbi:MAG: BamA/TamA family outer membrane protein [candidate division Zixibacteria bacterium]|nr:BamA/TamA family outer membrane protein [candidate division Zixibacteria bacterium]